MADGDGKVAAGLVTFKLVTLRAQGDRVVRVNKWNFSTTMAVSEIIIRATKEHQAAEAAGEKDANGMGWLARVMGKDAGQAFEILRLSMPAEDRQHVSVDMDGEDAFALFDALSELNRGGGALVKKASGLPGQFLGLLGSN